MRYLCKVGLLGLATALFVAWPIEANTKLQKLAPDRYLVSHKAPRYIGYGQAKVLQSLNEKAASLCLLLGYSWFEVGDKENKTRGWTNAAATADVRLFEERNSDDSIECAPLATEEEKKRVEKALRKIGVDPEEVETGDGGS